MDARSRIRLFLAASVAILGTQQVFLWMTKGGSPEELAHAIPLLLAIVCGIGILGTNNSQVPTMGLVVLLSIIGLRGTVASTLFPLAWLAVLNDVIVCACAVLATRGYMWWRRNRAQ
ncbi:MAG: hypothetical protein Q8K89_05110 [Actinomycetota bacterium]|nr:hypothetical protein [Actinomycetota bacterium]